MTLIESLLSQDDAGQKALRQQDLLVAVSEQIWGAIEKEHINLQTLAERIGTSKSDLSQKLNSRRNLTLRSLSDIADALGYVAKVELEPKVECQNWQSPVTLNSYRIRPLHGQKLYEAVKTEYSEPLRLRA